MRKLEVHHSWLDNNHWTQQLGPDRDLRKEGRGGDGEGEKEGEEEGEERGGEGGKRESERSHS